MGEVRKRSGSTQSIGFTCFDTWRIQQSGRRFTFALSPDGKTLACGSTDHTVRLWNIAAGTEQTVLQGDSDALAFSPDGSTLAIRHENTIRLWDVANARESAAVHRVIADGFGIAFSPDGTKLAITGWYGCGVALREVSTEEHLVSLAAREPALRVIFSPDGATLATIAASDYGIVRFWDIVTGDERDALEVSFSRAEAVSFRPDWGILACGSENHIVCLEVSTGHERAVLAGHTGEVRTLAFSPDGAILASGSEDHTVRIWDPAEERELIVLQGHTGSISDVAFDSVGSILASCSNDNTIRLWKRVQS